MPEEIIFYTESIDEHSSIQLLVDFKKRLCACVGVGEGEEPPYSVRKMLHCTCRWYNPLFSMCVQPNNLLIIVIVWCAYKMYMYCTSSDHDFF